jgi:hypothetical protein
MAAQIRPKSCHSAFFGPTAFIGAGLVFSGVTDTCGMGMLLAKIAWKVVESIERQSRFREKIKIQKFA